MKTKQKQQHGFTLIEMMIVVAIIGILAALALPSYQIYATRAKLLEVTNFSAAAKILIWEEYFTRGSMPEDTTYTATYVENMMLTSEYISDAIYAKIDDTTASLVITFQNISAINGKTMIYNFTTNTEIIMLDCRGGTMEDKYRPASCRSNS